MGRCKSKDLSCLNCNRVYSHCQNLCRHKQHCIVKKSFSCSNCKKCFTRKDLLKEHLKVCTGIKAETECNLCLKEFKFPYYFKRHMEQVHKIEKKSCSCEKCGKTCVWEKKFLEHQTTCGEIHKKKKDPTGFFPISSTLNVCIIKTNCIF